VLHAGRTKAPKAGEPRAAAMLAQWRTAKTFYATPFGSNDDWCGLPVPITPCRRCLLVLPTRLVIPCPNLLACGGGGSSGICRFNRCYACRFPILSWRGTW